MNHHKRYDNNQTQPLFLNLSREDVCDTLTLSKIDYERLKLKIWEDNQSSMRVLKQSSYKRDSRLGHLPLKVHWLREQTTSGVFEVHYASSKKQKADIMTKTL